LGKQFLVNDFYKSFLPEYLGRRSALGQPNRDARFVSARGYRCDLLRREHGQLVYSHQFGGCHFLVAAGLFPVLLERFNVWGELAATILGLPLAYLVWFVLGFEKQPIWMGTGILFGIAMATLVIVTLLTPKEKDETLLRFFERCRPLAGWKTTRKRAAPSLTKEPSLGGLIVTSVLGMLACLGLTVATNAVFVQNWPVFGICALLAIFSSAGLLYRLSEGPAAKQEIPERSAPLEVPADLS
jgi:hypothetical protein